MSSGTKSSGQDMTTLYKNQKGTQIKLKKKYRSIIKDYIRQHQEKRIKNKRIS